jgi:hypothetical protein
MRPLLLTLALAGCIPAATHRVVMVGECPEPVAPDCPDCPPCPQVQAPRPQAACVVSAPPKRPEALLAGGGGCPGRFTACLDVESEMRLTAYLRELEWWAEDAAKRCGRAR